VPELSIVDRHSIDNYLYDAETKYKNINNRKRFDLMDFIIIVGDCNLMPWESRCAKLQIFFHMSKVANKHMFCTGMGMQFLTNFCATGT
jgi:hypothetical protein